MTDKLVVQCPNCKKPVHWNDKFPHRPFCSERCKRIDFGDWAGENHRIAGVELMEPSGENAELFAVDADSNSENS